MIIENDIYESRENSLESLIKTFNINVIKDKAVVRWHFKNEVTANLLKNLMEIDFPFENVELTNTSLLETIFNNNLQEGVEI